MVKGESRPHAVVSLPRFLQGTGHRSTGGAAGATASQAVNFAEIDRIWEKTLYDDPPPTADVSTEVRRSVAEHLREELLSLLVERHVKTSIEPIVMDSLKDLLPALLEQAFNQSEAHNTLARKAANDRIHSKLDQMVDRLERLEKTIERSAAQSSRNAAHRRDNQHESLVAMENKLKAVEKRLHSMEESIREVRASTKATYTVREEVESLRKWAQNKDTFDLPKLREELQTLSRHVKELSSKERHDDDDVATVVSREVESRLQRIDSSLSHQIEAKTVREVNKATKKWSNMEKRIANLEETIILESTKLASAKDEISISQSHLEKLKKLVDLQLRSNQDLKEEWKGALATTSNELSQMIREYVSFRLHENNKLIDKTLRARVPDYLKNEKERFVLVRSAEADSNLKQPQPAVIVKEGSSTENVIEDILKAFGNDKEIRSINCSKMMDYSMHEEDIPWCNGGDTAKQASSSLLDKPSS